MRRRDVLILGGAAVAAPFRARAQKAMPVIGSLNLAPAAAISNSSTFRGFDRGLGEMGFVDGRNITIETRFADWDPARLPNFAADFVARKVDVIAAFGGPTALAAKNTTATIPIVFLNGNDPVKTGLVASLNRPGGNVTGLTFLTTELGPKRLELLRELLPTGSTIAMLVDPNNPDSQAELERVQRAAQTLGQNIQVVRASTEQDFDRAFQEVVRLHCAALLVGTGGLFGNHPQRLAALAQRYAVPSIFDRREPVDAGGLIGYGTSFLEVSRRAGILVGRILKGERPADLPVERPSVFEVVINLRTAKSLGLTIPQSLLARANEVIE